MYPFEFKDVFWEMEVLSDSLPSAHSLGITRSVIVNALRKLESAGVIVSESSGMKGTYIKVTNELIYDEIEELKKKW